MKVVVTEAQIQNIHSKMKDVDEDIFLKKDPTTQKLIVFSDKEDKNARTKETIGLAKEFRKLGFDWKPDLGHWVGDYDKLPIINELIKKYNKVKGIIDQLEKIEDFVESQDVDPTKKNIIMDNLEKYINDLANATDQAALDASIRNYLTFYSKFHNYSLTNTWLIFLQKRDAKKVAGYNTWKKLNRGVKKGATAIYIWFPMQVKSDDVKTDYADSKELDAEVKSGRMTTRFNLGKVYDISDTYPLKEGEDVPETPIWYASNEPSEVADELVMRLKDFAASLGIKITQDTAKGGEKGYSAGDHINLSSDVAGVGAASTLVHEMAHELLHWRDKSIFHIPDEGDDIMKMLKGDREMKELQAESVSYVVMKHYDLPVTQHPTYLVLWKANRDKIMKNMHIITKCAKFIIDGIDSAELKKPEVQQPQINESMKLTDILTESKAFDTFAEKRMGGAEKIADSAKEKGGPSMLTYHHFKVKLPYYKKAAEGKFDMAEAKKEFNQCVKELSDDMEQIAFQKLVGRIEVLGELIIKHK